MEVINNVINEFIRQQKEHTEKALAEIITKYDFAVGSMELKQQIMEILPEGANIVYSPYIESPTTIYAIKKFDVMDLLSEPQEKRCSDCSHYGKLSLDCGRCDEDCSMFEPTETDKVSYDQALDGMKSEYPTGKELDAFLEYKRDKKGGKE